jgi:thiamine-phosphate pyrophosphorylase
VTEAMAKLSNEARRFNARGLPSLVLMTDDDRLADPCAAASRLPHGSLVVVRARTPEHRARLAAALARIARARELVLVVADDPGLVARLGSHGVHFPEARAGEIAYWRARRPDWLITASAHSLRAAARDARFGADAVFMSPIFATESHVGRAPLGPLRLRMMTQIVDVPVYALGGINQLTARQLRGAKIAGIAAIGALSAWYVMSERGHPGRILSAK